MFILDVLFDRSGVHWVKIVIEFKTSLMFCMSSSLPAFDGLRRDRIKMQKMLVKCSNCERLFKSVKQCALVEV